MSEEARQESGGQTSLRMVLVGVLWALVPLLWSVYQTLTAVVALFAA